MDRWTPASSRDSDALAAGAAGWIRGYGPAAASPSPGAAASSHGFRFGAVDELAAPAWPPPPPEGTWRPADRFRSSHIRARWTLIGFAVTITSLLLDAAIFPVLVSALDRRDHGAYVYDELQGMVDFGMVVAACTILGLAVASIGFLAWLSRLTDNAPWLGVGMPSISPRGAILWWFVPVASLMKPYQSVGELQRRLAPSDAVRRNGNRLVIAWWLTFVGGTIVREIAQVYMVRTGYRTLAEASGPLAAAFAGDVVWAVSAALTVVLVRRMERDAAARAEALGYRRDDKAPVVFAGPAPAWSYAQAAPWQVQVVPLWPEPPRPAPPGAWYAQPVDDADGPSQAIVPPAPGSPPDALRQVAPGICPACGAPRSRMMPYCGMCGTRLW